jgi:hypothetical protein
MREIPRIHGLLFVLRFPQTFGIIYNIPDSVETKPSL